MEKKERDFKGVWIPKILWLNTDLSIIEKCLLVEIDSLDNDPNKGCWASNEYLGQFIGVSEGRCANIISALKKRGYISQVFFDGRNRGLRAHYNILESITKSESSFNENVKAQLTETLDHTSRKREHSNIDNNTSNNQEKETPISFPKANKKESKGTSSDKGRSNSMRGGADEATKQAFEEFRLYAKKVGMSGARGLETEYEYFTKKHKDYETVIPILLTCLQSEVAEREIKKKANEFVPAFKNFLTWVNKRAWETYEKVEVQETSEPNILQMNPQQIADHIRAKIDSKEWTEEEGKAKYRYYQDNRPKKYG